MLKQASKEAKALFLLEFTKELIKNSNSSAFYEIQAQLKEKEQTEKERIEEIRKGAQKKVRENLETSEKTTFKPLPTTFQIKPFKRARVLRIPEPRLPERLQYLRPFATNLELDLGVINPLINDINVETIECDGKNENLIVRGRIGEKTTTITLTEEDINTIIQTFSQKTKLPVDEGVFNAVFGRLKISAIYSEMIGSKFIIKKIR
jgi:hypothetical protein